MKNLFLVATILVTSIINAQVGIGTTTPHATAELDVTSITKGFLPPRMTYAQKVAIVSPASGLIIWCTNCGANGELQVYNGTSWMNLSVTSGSAATPNAPTNVVATASDAEASVAFTIPSSNGGSTITGYTVTSTPGNITGTGTSSPIVVTGLTNGTSYTFTVIATNSIGNSTASSASIAVSPVATVVTPSYSEVTSSTGRIWMDRNLGATQVATSGNDTAAYGDLYQWGRGTDGHQIRTSNTTSTISATDSPGHGNFILGDFANNNGSDWRATQNNNLWQGINGTNNPCPNGFRLPTEAEWTAEKATWSSFDATGAFSSALKLPLNGQRIDGTGQLMEVGTVGYYWTSTVSGSDARGIGFMNGGGGIMSKTRTAAHAVRCIKN